MDWGNLMKQSVTVGAQSLWSGRHGCNKWSQYGCAIAMSYPEINLRHNGHWPLTCMFLSLDLQLMRFTYLARTPLTALICTGACDSSYTVRIFETATVSVYMRQKIYSHVNILIWHKREDIQLHTAWHNCSVRGCCNIRYPPLIHYTS